MPSKVEVNCFCWAALAGQSAVGETEVTLEDEPVHIPVELIIGLTDDAGALTTQKGEVLVTQKTSRQQVETPRLVGRFANTGEFLDGRE